MSETSKAQSRRLADGFFRYCRGSGLDIGCGSDPLFPDIAKFDILFGDGDATYMKSVSNQQFDYVYSSHCLEHLWNPVEALRNWFRILKPGGNLLLYVPHRDLYEKRRHLPSHWNPDHKFFILPDKNDPPHTWSLETLLEIALRDYSILLLRTCDFDHTITDPNLHSDGEYSIECVARKEM